MSSDSPRTAAGQAMYAKWGSPQFLEEWNAAILAIEAEAATPAASGDALDRCEYVCWRERGHNGGHVMTGDRFPPEQPDGREGAS